MTVLFIQTVTYEREAGLELKKEVSYKKHCSDFYINQIVTVHGAIPDHQARYFGKYYVCLCGFTIGSIEHIIKHCILTHNIRNESSHIDWDNITVKKLLSTYSGSVI